MYLERVMKKLTKLNLALPGELLGCTQSEVNAIEQALEISLPKAYQEFILSMGHGAGKFLQGSDCFLQDLPYLQKWAVELLNENKFSESLPKDAFVFLMHQGYQFSFFSISEGDDPPTYSYCEGTNQTGFIISHDKFSDFLLTEVEIQAKYLYSKVTV